MGRILLLRHAKAAWPNPGMKDFDRPLDPQGFATLDQLAKAMTAAALWPEIVVCSAARRTRDTLQYLLPAFTAVPEIQIDDSLYGGNARHYLDAIRKASQNTTAQTIMLVGHNPSIEDLAHALCHDGNDTAIRNLKAGFPPAALATISVNRELCTIEAGSGYLEHFPVPA